MHVQSQWQESTKVSSSHALNIVLSTDKVWQLASSASVVELGVQYLRDLELGFVVYQDGGWWGLDWAVWYFGSVCWLQHRDVRIQGGTGT